MPTNETRDQILKLKAEGGSQRGIADQLGCSRDVVRRVLAKAAKQPGKKAKPKAVPATKKNVKVEVVNARLGFQEVVEALKKNKGIKIDELSGEVHQQLVEAGHMLHVVHGSWQFMTNLHALEDVRPVPDVFRPNREWHRMLVITDMHFGGHQAQSWFVLQMIQEAEKRKADVILNVGDTFDGSAKMHAGFAQELGLVRMDDQIDFAAQVFNTSQVPMLGIGGNHCGSFTKDVGVDPCRILAERVKAYHHIGPIQGWVEGPTGDPNFIRLFHPGDGCSYALSYKDQKTAEYLVLQNDRVPTGFHFTGHYHKYNKMVGPNGSYFFLAPAACGITPFMRARRLINMSGALFIEFTVDAAGRVDRMIEEHIPLHPSEWRYENYADFLGRDRKRGAAPKVWI